MNLADYLNTYSNTSTVDWSSIGPALAKLGVGQNGRDGSAGWDFEAPTVENGRNNAWTLSPEAAAKLQGWTVGDPRLQGDTRTQQITDASGQAAGVSNEDVSQSMFWDKLMPGAIAAGMGYFAGPALGGAFGGGLLGGAAGGAVTGGALAGATGGNVGQGLLTGGLLGGISGAMGNVPATGGDIASSVAGVPGEMQGAVDAYAQAPMPDMMQGMPDMGGAQSFPVAPNLPSWTDAVHGQNVAALDQFAQQPMQMPVPEWQQATAPSWLDSVKGENEASLQQASQQTPAQVASTMPDIPSMTSAAQIPSEYRPSVDSQAYNQAAGITGDQAAAAATVPGSVNLANAGGTMSTAGGLLGGLKDAGSWLTDPANKTLVKALMGGAGALLSSQPGGGSAAPKAYGAPAQWASPVQGMSQGLLSGPQVTKAPGALGLLGGQKNSGAWRFMG